MGNTVEKPVQHPVEQPLKKYCVDFHSRRGLDYPWLTQKYGVLIKAEFKEGDGEWTDYERLHQSQPNGKFHSWWVEHCQSVSHDVNDLAAKHVAFFVTPETRIAVMRFTFANGRVYRSDMDNDDFIDMYILEEIYARRIYEEAIRSQQMQ